VAGPSSDSPRASSKNIFLEALDAAYRAGVLGTTDDVEMGELRQTIASPQLMGGLQSVRHTTVFIFFYQYFLLNQKTKNLEWKS
jgi:hypothetical protein